MSGANEILIVDRRVHALGDLLKGLRESVVPIVIGPDTDPLDAIAGALHRHTGVSALHLVAHGAPGYLALGRGLDLSVIDARGYEISKAAHHLAMDAEILIYGCRVASGELGEAFVSRLEQLAGCPVAAAATPVGNESLGGTWDLEVTGGAPMTSIAFSEAACAAYRGLFVTFSGGAGNDTLTGSPGNDQINGKSGDDSIIGLGGDDFLIGEDGRDTLIGGDGADRLIAFVSVSGGENLGELFYGDAGDDQLFGDTGADTFYGGEDNDRIFGNAGNDILLGGEGDDLLSGEEGIDTLLGGGGSDTLIALAFSVFGGESLMDYFDGGPGDDSLSAGRGNDLLIGGAGDDTIIGERGADSILGNDGADLLYGNAKPEDIITTETGEFADGLNNTIFGGEGADTLYGGPASLGGGYDLLDGGADDDLIFGANGNDEITGGAGDDTIIGGPADADGPDGDLVYGGKGDDSISGGDDRDFIFGGKGKDTLQGGSRSDLLHGGQGKDLLIGDTNSIGFDTMIGGKGSDTFVYNYDNESGNPSSLTITDLVKQDTLVFNEVDGDVTSLAQAEAITSVTESGADVVISFNVTGNPTITLEGVGNGSIASLQDLVDAGFDLEFT